MNKFFRITAIALSLVSGFGVVAASAATVVSSHTVQAHADARPVCW